MMGSWVFPHEHGAYGQLGFPIVAALAGGHATPAALALVVACAAAFVVYEPALILLGQRGARALRDSAAAAKRTLLAAGLVAAGGGILGILLLDSTVRWTVFVPLGLALAAVPLVVGRAQKTAWGEMLVVLTLASCALPIGVASRLPIPSAAACWIVFTLGYWAATLAVRGSIARQRREPSAAARIAAAALATASPFIVHGIPSTGAWLWTATLPLSMLATVVAVVLPPARHLRRVGWTLIAASAVAAGVVVACARTAPESSEGGPASRASAAMMRNANSHHAPFV